MCRADPREASVVHECFNNYYNWSSQQANREKSNIFFSATTSQKDKKAIKEILGFKDMGSKVVYLGNSFIFGRSKIKEFLKLKDKIKIRLKWWNKQLLSKSGKATLIKSVVQAMLTYTRTTFNMPQWICEDLDAIVCRFWWKTKQNTSGCLALKTWRQICKLQELGGLRFRKFEDMNLAMLAKLGWKLASGEDYLWTKIIKARYLQNDTFLNYKLKKGDSRV